MVVHTHRHVHCLQGHYFDIYVNSPKFPEPWPSPQMAGVDPIAHQKAKQARLRQREQQTAASAAGVGPQGGSLGVLESMAAESGVQQAKRTAVSTDAETAHGPAKRVNILTYRQQLPDGFLAFRTLIQIPGCFCHDTQWHRLVLVF